MKTLIKLNRYPKDYEEEKMPAVIVEVRYCDDTYSKIKAEVLANEIEAFLKTK